MATNNIFFLNHNNTNYTNNNNLEQREFSRSICLVRCTNLAPVIIVIQQQSNQTEITFIYGIIHRVCLLPSIYIHAKLDENFAHRVKRRVATQTSSVFKTQLE